MNITYTLDQVPTYLLYEGAAWLIKTGRDKFGDIVFYRRSANNEAEACLSNFMQLNIEIARRQKEILGPDIHCQNPACNAVTDGRTLWEQKPICVVCYFNQLTAIAQRQGRPILVPPTVDKESVLKSMESPEEYKKRLAEKLGLPVELLEENGYFQ